MIKSPARVNVFSSGNGNPDDGNATRGNQIAQVIIFEDNLVAGTTPGRLLGHETGHLFTLKHDDRCQDVLMFGGVGITSVVAQGRILKGPQRNMRGRERPALTEIGLSG